MNVKDKVVVITGASSGIGLSTAKLLYKNGAKLSLAARSTSKLEVLSKELKGSIFIPTDMTKEEEIKDLIKKTLQYFGRVDILINNAGRGYDAPIEKTDPKKYREIFDLNVIGYLIVIQEVIPIMRKQKGGMIINVSSGTSLMYLPNMAAYSSTKRTVNTISLIARQELERDNIIVSVVYPYITTTDFEKNTIKDIENYIEEETESLRPPDPPELVAGKILEVIKTGEAEMFAHDWMKKLK